MAIQMMYSTGQLVGDLPKLVTSVSKRLLLLLPCLRRLFSLLLMALSSIPRATAHRVMMTILLAAWTLLVKNGNIIALLMALHSLFPHYKQLIGLCWSSLREPRWRLWR